MAGNHSTSFSTLYPSLFKLGLTSQILLSVTDDSDHESDVESLRVDCLSNQNVLELHEFMQRSPSCTYYTLWKWMSSLSKKWPKTVFPTVKSLRQSVVRLSSRFSKCSHRNSKIRSYQNF